MSDVSALISLMIQHDIGDPESICRMMSVYGFARTIALEENVSAAALEAIEAAVIARCLVKDNDAAYSDILLLNLGCDRELMSKVHRLTADSASGEEAERQIIAEAEFLVSAFDRRLDKESIAEAEEKLFKTDTGKQYLKDMYAIE